MKSMYLKLTIFILIVGLFTACGTQATTTPAFSPTEAVALATQASTDLPVSTDTSAPAATEAPTTQPVAQGATVSFANDVLPIIESRCINCHGGDRVEKGLNLKTYADM